MSTSREIEGARTEDRLITLISSWLGGHRGNAELLRDLEGSGTDGLGPGQVEALHELIEGLGLAAHGERGELEMLARETLEALALGA